MFLLFLGKNRMKSRMEDFMRELIVVSVESNLEHGMNLAVVELQFVTCPSKIWVALGNHRERGTEELQDCL